MAATARMDNCPCWQLPAPLVPCGYNAMTRVPHTNAAAMRPAIAQPMARLECSPSTTAKCSQPPSVQIPVMPDTHFRSGLSALKPCPNKSGATGNGCLLLVAALCFLATFALKPLVRMILATRCWPAGSLSALSLRATRKISISFFPFCNN